ncbi:MAG: helix-turn-helix transcriptional regulator [Bacteroidales bacterium]|nr:helix-turn-helix transcriptional regulator [Bacteroidales bacterium]
MEGLTEKEIEIARHGASGKTVQEIADVMCLSPETIRWYRKRMLRKVEARNFAELIAKLKDENIF